MALDRFPRQDGYVTPAPDQASTGATALIDLHAHVLPRVDDGPRDEAQSLEMLRIAAADGISAIVATPHAHHTRPAAVQAGVERLNALAATHQVDVRVLPGSEIRIGPGIVERIREGHLFTLNGSASVLIELYLHDEWPLALVERAFDRLLSAGLLPVLAHAERYPFVQRDPRVLDHFICRQIPVQINAGALFYRESDIERRVAERLLRERRAHLIASDAHNARYRPPRLRKAFQRAAELTDDHYAGWMRANALSVLDGASVQLPVPNPSVN
jgi:protein-tyrosine phosphatase